MSIDPNGDLTEGVGPILIVDDEPYIREILSRWLTDEGYACEQAADAAEALETLSGQDFALMISDIRMPGRSGLELLDEATARYSDLAIIMLTAVDHRETAIRTLEAGAYGYVITPFDRPHQHELPGSPRGGGRRAHPGAAPPRRGGGVAPGERCGASRR